MRTWKPDTCSCIIDLDSETVVGGECQRHSQSENKFEAARSDNFKKNMVCNFIYSLRSVASQGEQADIFSFMFAYDGSLKITINADVDKAYIQSHVNAQFGQGYAEIV